MVETSCHELYFAKLNLDELGYPRGFQVELLLFDVGLCSLKWVVMLLRTPQTRSKYKSCLWLISYKCTNYCQFKENQGKILQRAQIDLEMCVKLKCKAKCDVTIQNTKKLLTTHLKLTYRVIENSFKCQRLWLFISYRPVANPILPQNFLYNIF